MFKNFIQWRSDIKIEDVKRFKYEELDQVKKFYPHGYFRTDREGRPIYIECAGQIKHKEMMEVTNEDRFNKYFIQSYEHLLHVKFPACSRAVGKRVSSTIYIMDLKGGSLKLVGGKTYDFIKTASKIGQDYYPEILGQMFIVNAPMLFTGVWAAIKPWIDEKTRNKIKILGSKYEKEIQAVIDPENLPDFLGGKVPVSEYGQDFQNEQGPWVGEKTDAEKEDDEERKEEDFDSLKNALSGLKLGGNIGGGSKAQHLHDQPLMTESKPPADTPLNTQMDADDDTH